MTTAAKRDERETIAEFIADLGITMEAVKHDRRPDGLMPDSPNHWRVTLRLGENGDTMSLWFSGGSAVRSIDAADVLNCLLMDHIDAGLTFEEWACDLGYDTDSRKAEATFNACVKQCKQARAWLGGDNYARLLDCEGL